MVIGRTDAGESPWGLEAVRGRCPVWTSSAEPIWASGQTAASKGRTHDRKRTEHQFPAKTLLNPRGRPHTDPKGPGFFGPRRSLNPL